MSSYVVTVNGNEFAVSVEVDGTVVLNGAAIQFDMQQLDSGTYSLIVDAVSSKIIAQKAEASYQLLINGKQIEATVESERTRLLKTFGTQSLSGTTKSEIKAPMPALVVRVEVQIGDEVEAGQGLLILEAMKMENEIKTHRAGKVKGIYVTKGKTVEKGELLMQLE